MTVTATPEIKVAKGATCGPSEVGPEVLAEYDAAYWAVLNAIRLKADTFAIYPDHAYQLDPMTAHDRRVCCMKATQGGFTEVWILRSLHGMIHRRYPQGVLYLFPTTDDVGEFSKSRFGPLIAANKNAIGRFVKSGGKGKGTDTASLKKIHDAFLYLRGARLSQSIEGGSDDKESSKLRSVPVDCVVFDELDLMDETVIAKALGRMGHSKVKEEIYISNPTIPGRGIDRMFSQSDQRHWHRRCGCGTWTCAEESFPDCVRIGDAGRGYIACSKCGKAVLIYAGKGTGEWVAKKPEVKDLAGYRWSQLSSAFNDPADILKEFNDPANPNLADTYRLRLGLPYIPKEDQLTEGQVFDCCGNEPILQGFKGPCGMGVDLGKSAVYVVIGIRVAKDRFEILRLARVPMDGWENTLHDLARAFNVRSEVDDIRPYEDTARKHQKAESHRILLCEYTENALTENAVDEDAGIVKSYRTGLCDSTHRLIAEKRLTLPRRCPEVELFAEQTVSMAKVLEKNKKTGVAVYRYISSGPDHYRHSLNYAYLAMQRLQVVSPFGAVERPRVALHAESAI
ncbi:hypothetical protein ES708_19831 [subsurface metagenome]